MPDSEDEGAELFVSYAMPYVYVFWAQAEPARFEIAAVQQADPRFREMDVSQVTSLLKGKDYWRIGPVEAAAEADAIELKLKESGLRVERRWQ